MNNETLKSAGEQALAFISADAVLQNGDQDEIAFCLREILRLEYRAGETDVTKLANLAVRKLRHREQAKLAAASIYKKYDRSIVRYQTGLHFSEVS